MAAAELVAAGAHRFTFGTYKKAGNLLDVALRQALGDAGGRIFLVDTALMYGNQAEVAAIMKDFPGARVGSKVNRPGNVAADLLEIESVFPSLHRVLLHRPMPLADWRVLEEAKIAGRLAEIGVCNYSAEKLQELLRCCRVKPDVVQNELHPCIDTPVPELCRKHGIRFEAHSVMAANAQVAPVLEARLQVTAAQAAIAYCLARGADVCFSTANLQHLRQDLAPELANLLRPQDVEELARLAFKHPIRLYRAQGSSAADEALLYDRLVKDIAAFRANLPFSDTCIHVPKTHRGTQGELAKSLSRRFFPEAAGTAAHQKFDGLLHKMRKAIEARDAEARAVLRSAAPKTCALPRHAVAFPDALPVDIPAPECFDDFLQELRALPTPGRQGYPRRLQKGTLFPDGRMDLCKQVIQPRFEDLCTSVEASGAVRHFLLGNNVVFRDGTEGDVASRLGALVKLLCSDPAIETWYLAGNGINAELSEPIANAFKNASRMNALWLKMNPVKTGARHFGGLAAAHRGLELLDLFNTGLCDSGVRAFRDGLAAHGGSRTLKHLYLSVNDITDGEAVADIVLLLPALESLFLGVNLLGDAGAAPVLRCLVGHPTLQRLEFGANGLSDASLPLLLEVAARSPALQALTLGSYKSTAYFDGRHNDLTDAGMLARIAGHLGFLNLNGGIEGLDLDALERGLRSDAPETLVYAAQGQAGAVRTLRAGDVHERRGLQHPQPFIQNIESIYRNQM
mmetsp:Transcript_67478/g.197364  ORF Transcript_67478/g.197364 Transcript_67478/m.197364 type:complete len:739 (+) Transcript_67478:87-2303(+)